MHEPGSCSTSHDFTTRKKSRWNYQWPGQCWFYSLKRPLFSSRSFVVCLWRHRSSDQDDVKGKKPRQWDMFPESTELLLIGYSTASIWIPKSKSNTFTSKTNSQTYWPKEISHVMNGRTCCVFNISRFSSTVCSEAMAKRSQQNSGDERVTAKSKPMMNLVSRCSERTPDVLASTASESPGKTRHESQIPLSSWNEQHPERWDLF